MGVDKVKDLTKYYGDPKLEPDPAVDLSLIDGRVIELYTAFRNAIRFTPDEIVAEYRDERAVGQLAEAVNGPNPIDPASSPRISAATTGWCRASSRGAVSRWS